VSDADETAEEIEARVRALSREIEKGTMTKWLDGGRLRLTHTPQWPAIAKFITTDRVMVQPEGGRKRVEVVRAQVKIDGEDYAIAVGVEKLGVKAARERAIAALRTDYAFRVSKNQ
jgi:hypothetical protein